MSSLHALRCLPSVKKQKKRLSGFFIQCIVIIKHLLDLVFVIFRIIMVLVGVISLRLQLQLNHPYLNHEFSGYHKTLSNNSLRTYYNMPVWSKL